MLLTRALKAAGAVTMFEFLTRSARTRLISTRPAVGNLGQDFAIAERIKIFPKEPGEIHLLNPSEMVICKQLQKCFAMVSSLRNRHGAGVVVAPEPRCRMHEDGFLPIAISSAFRHSDFFKQSPMSVPN